MNCRNWPFPCIQDKGNRHFSPGLKKVSGLAGPAGLAGMWASHEMPELAIFTHSAHRKKAFFGQGSKKWILFEAVSHFVFQRCDVRPVFKSLSFRNAFSRCVLKSLPVTCVILRRAFHSLSLRIVFFRCVFDTGSSENTCFTGVAPGFFTTAPYVNSRLCILRRDSEVNS